VTAGEGEVGSTTAECAVAAGPCALWEGETDEDGTASSKAGDDL
jgi:hypothetical protein